MFKNKVVITGTGTVSPFGWGNSHLMHGLESGACSLDFLAQDDAIIGMSTKIGGKTPDFDLKFIPREYRRSMPKSALMALIAAYAALQASGITPSLPLNENFTDMGIAIGTTLGSSASLDAFFSDFLPDRSVDNVRGTLFFKIMAHTAPSNLAVAFGLRGRCLSPAAACAAGLQAIGLGYECIAVNGENAMLCGGTEEFHPLLPATFDRLGAASLSSSPSDASRPFDKKRDGIVCSEGAGMMLLESEERAISRNVDIIGEVVAFASNTSPGSIVSPDSNAIYECMQKALATSGLAPQEIGLVNAHATATEQGDIAEGQAIYKLFGNKTPVNSLKGHMGHAMAASGAIELIASMLSARKNKLVPTRNMPEQDPLCGDLNIFDKIIPFFRTPADKHGYLLKNSFGLGGVNSSIIIKVTR